MGQEQAALLALQLAEVLGLPQTAWGQLHAMQDLGSAPKPSNQGADGEFTLPLDKLWDYQLLPLINEPWEQLILGAHPQTSLLTMRCPEHLGVLTYLESTMAPTSGDKQACTGTAGKHPAKNPLTPTLHHTQVSKPSAMHLESDARRLPKPSCSSVWVADPSQSRRRCQLPCHHCRTRSPPAQAAARGEVILGKS